MHEAETETDPYGTSDRGSAMSEETGSPVDWQALAASRMRELKKVGEARHTAEKERTQLVAWLAQLYSAVIAPAPDVSEPGWQIIYLSTGEGQLSWHIAPADDELFPASIPRVNADDPRAVWDGHTTQQKYNRIQALVGWPKPAHGDINTNWSSSPTRSEGLNYIDTGRQVDPADGGYC